MIKQLVKNTAIWVLLIAVYTPKFVIALKNATMSAKVLGTNW